MSFLNFRFSWTAASHGHRYQGSSPTTQQPVAMNPINESECPASDSLQTTSGMDCSTRSPALNEPQCETLAISLETGGRSDWHGNG